MKETSRRTVNHYQDHAQAYREGTWDHDVSQNRQALLAAIGASGPVDILDLGCGPGRDLEAFKALGHRPVGLDGCAAFVEMARQQTGLSVLHQDFLDLSLPHAAFDGVFANAVLFHIPSAELPAVLVALRQSLRPGGVLSPPIRAGRGKKGGTGSATVVTTVGISGCSACSRPVMSTLIIFTGPPTSPRRSNIGWLRYGVYPPKNDQNGESLTCLLRGLFYNDIYC